MVPPIPWTREAHHRKALAFFKPGVGIIGAQAVAFDGTICRVPNCAAIAGGRRNQLSMRKRNSLCTGVKYIIPFDYSVAGVHLLDGPRPSYEFYDKAEWHTRGIGQGLKIARTILEEVLKAQPAASRSPMNFTDELDSLIAEANRDMQMFNVEHHDRSKAIRDTERYRTLREIALLFKRACSSEVSN